MQRGQRPLARSCAVHRGGPCGIHSWRAAMDCRPASPWQHRLGIDGIGSMRHPPRPRPCWKFVCLMIRLLDSHSGRQGVSLRLSVRTANVSEDYAPASCPGSSSLAVTRCYAFIWMALLDTGPASSFAPPPPKLCMLTLGLSRRCVARSVIFGGRSADSSARCGPGAASPKRGSDPCIRHADGTLRRIPSTPAVQLPDQRAGADTDH